MVEILRGLKQRASAFEGEAHQILSRYETSKSRVVVDQTHRRLKGLSLQQEELFREALSCIEGGNFRAAHVMAWAAFADFLEQMLASDGLTKLKSVRSGWSKYATMEQLRENVPEHQLIEAALDVGLLSKSEMKTILGLLSKRNECAHPGSYLPGLNEALGYVSELLRRVERLQTKHL